MNISINDAVKEIAFREHNAIGHKRKYSGEPYTVHLEQVADFIFNYMSDFGSKWYLSQAVAYGHDLFEDTLLTKAQLASELVNKYLFDFSEVSFVVEGIDSLTDKFTSVSHPHLNRKQRKILEHGRLVGIDYQYKMVKVADMISNTSDITENDPAFAKIYLKEIGSLITQYMGDEDVRTTDLFYILLDTYIESTNSMF